MVSYGRVTRMQAKHDRAGYGNFQKLMTLMQSKQRVRSKAAKIDYEDQPWNNISYCVFDAPSEGRYEDRLQLLRNNLTESPIVRLTLPQLCQSKTDLENYLQQVVSRGGEGVVLRKPNSHYVYGRSSNMLKVKRHKDTEVQLIRPHESNTLLCLQYVPCRSFSYIDRPNGQNCIVKCSVDTFNNPPPNGSVITVQHAGSWTSGRLKYPFFSRIRSDMTWDAVLKHAQENSS